MGYQKLYCYLVNKEAKVTMSPVRKALYRANVQSKVVTYYKKGKQEHRVSPNLLECSFQPEKKVMETVVCPVRESIGVSL